MASNGVAMKFLLFLSSWVVLLGVSFSSAQTVPALYVFGDSLVDVGNNNYLKLSLAKADFPHNGVDYPGRKPTGRFSNGKNAADFLAEKVGLPTSPPYLSDKTGVFHQGVSFASGGAGIFDGTDEEYRQSIPLTKQLAYYSTVYEATVTQLGTVAAQQHFSKSIFAIVIGSNDILGYSKSGSNKDKPTEQEYVNSMISNLQGHLMRLHDLGARKFVFTGIGAVGCCPQQRSHSKSEECNEEANLLSTKYNDGLKLMLQGLQSQLKDINYSYFDTYAVFSNFIQHPENYGFAEVKAACCGLGKLNAQIPCTPISAYCSNRTDHIFWDLYHPTERAASIFVDLIYSDSQPYVTPMNVKQLVAL